MNRQQLETFWDIFMLIVATTNLMIILFDFTYISLRPRYIKYFPELVQWYDPYKGIEPHQLTDSYVKLADSLYQRWRTQGPLSQEELTTFGDTLFKLSKQILSERPYERFGLMAYQEQLKVAVKEFIATHYGQNLRSTEAFRHFWELTPTNAALHLDFYEREMRYLLQVNYYRHYDLSGDYVDNFWKIDLPFLVFFWIEFWAAWLVAIRVRRYAYWWMYPIAHWYDVLALIPLTSLRWFRLLRIWSLYLRLNRSRVINFSNTLFARFLNQQSRLIAKAISDEVAYQILEQIKRQIKEGEEIRHTTMILEELRPTILKLLEEEAAPLVASLRNNPTLLKLIEDSVIQTMERELPSFPGLPKDRILPFAGKAARQIAEKILLNVENYLASEAGKKTLSGVTEGILTHVVERLRTPEMQKQLQHTILLALGRLQQNFRQGSSG